MSKFIEFTAPTNTTEAQEFLQTRGIETGIKYNLIDQTVYTYTVINNEGNKVCLGKPQLGLMYIYTKETCEQYGKFKEGMLIKPSFGTLYTSKDKVYKVFDRFLGSFAIIDDDGDVMGLSRYSVCSESESEDFYVVGIEKVEPLFPTSKLVESITDLQAGDVVVPLEDSIDLKKGRMYLVERDDLIRDDADDLQNIRGIECQVFTCPSRELTAIPCGNEIKAGSIAKCEHSLGSFRKGMHYVVQEVEDVRYLVSEEGDVHKKRAGFTFYKVDSAQEISGDEEKVEEKADKSLIKEGDFIQFKEDAALVDISKGRKYQIIKAFGELGFRDDAGDLRRLRLFSSSSYEVVEGETDEEVEFYIAVSSPFFTKNSIVKRDTRDNGSDLFILVSGYCTYNNGPDRSAGAFDDANNFAKLYTHPQEEAVEKAGYKAIEKSEAQVRAILQELDEVVSSLELVRAKALDLSFDLRDAKYQ